MPAEPRAARRRFAVQTVQQLQALFGAPRGPGSATQRGAALATVITSMTGLAAMGALLLAQMQARLPG